MPRSIIVVIAIFFQVLIWSVPAMAKNIFFEPYVGLSKVELHFTNSTHVSNGFSLGAKLGWQKDRKYFVALDYENGGPFVFGADLNDAEWTQNMVGLGFGADYRTIRFWAGYYFDTLIQDTTNNVDYRATSLKGAVGLPAGRKIRVNIELTSHDLTQAISDGNTTEINGLRVASTQISISVPLDL